MGLTNIEKESNTLDASVFTKSGSLLSWYYIHLYSTLLNFQVKKSFEIIVGEELACRKLVVHFMLYYSGKRFFR